MRTHVSTAGVPPGAGARRVLLAPYPSVGINLPKARSAGACPPQIPYDTIASQPTGEA